MGLTPLRFATYLAPCDRRLYEVVADACGASELVDGGDWRELQAGEIDVAFICSPPVVWLRGAVEPIAAPVLVDARFANRPLYCSDVVVRRGSPFRSLADLKGARWAINESSSWSGYWVTLQRLGSWDFFGEVVTAGFHHRAMGMVARGEVDAAAIDCHVLAVESAAHPSLAESLEIIDTLGPAPTQPVVVRSGLDADARAELTVRLQGLRADTLKPFLVEGFVPPPDYSAIAAVVGPFPPTSDKAGRPPPAR